MLGKAMLEGNLVLDKLALIFESCLGLFEFRLTWVYQAWNHPGLPGLI